MRASSEATIACSRARAVSASLAALIFSISRRWLICACSSSWPQDQALLGRLELRLAHRDVGIGLDLGALLLVDGDDLGEPAHADRVEGVVLVERRERRLVQPRQRHRVEQDAVLRQVVAQQAGRPCATNSARFSCSVSIVSARGDRLHRVDEAALEQVADAVGRERLGAERLRGGGHAFDAWAARARRTRARRRRACGLR